MDINDPTDAPELKPGSPHQVARRFARAFTPHPEPDARAGCELMSSDLRLRTAQWCLWWLRGIGEIRYEDELAPFDLDALDLNDLAHACCRGEEYAGPLWDIASGLAALEFGHAVRWTLPLARWSEMVPTEPITVDEVIATFIPDGHPEMTEPGFGPVVMLRFWMRNLGDGWKVHSYLSPPVEPSWAPDMTTGAPQRLQRLLNLV